MFFHSFNNYLFFQISHYTGEISTREPLDREYRAIHDLIAEARDQGTPYRSARVPIRITVSDVNDNAPEIVDPQEDVVSVREEQPSGTEVVKVRAIDGDNGYNATITYSILKGRDSDGYGLFTIDPATGVIKTRVSFDHEERSIYRLAIAATDGGKPPKQSVRLLRVEVLDLNDNRPTFTSSSLTFTVREDVLIGHVIGVVGGSHESDADNLNASNSGLHVTYTLTSLKTDAIEGAFDIDRNSGSLVVARSLDREQQSEYRLEVRALDTKATNNPQSSAVTIKVEIEDVNDNAPAWPIDPITINIIENTRIGSAVYNFSAIDLDTGVNAEIQYKLLRQMPFDMIDTFAVDPLSGTLNILKSIDYEELEEYLLIVSATDQSQNVSERLSTSVTARIVISDANDNVPVFVSPSDNDSILLLSDLTRIDQLVTHVVAIDQDSNENGRVSYSIINGNDEEYFSIDSDTGHLRLARSLSDASKMARYQYGNSGLANEKYSLVISAKDNGSPMSNEARTNLQIIIQRSKTNPPRFSESVYHANVSENMPIGTYVAQVAAKSFHSDNGK